MLEWRGGRTNPNKESSIAVKNDISWTFGRTTSMKQNEAFKNRLILVALLFKNILKEIDE